MESELPSPGSLCLPVVSMAPEVIVDDLPALLLPPSPPALLEVL